jgi:RHS repeat-associated protein
MLKRRLFWLLPIIAMLPALVAAQSQHMNQDRGFRANGVYSSHDIDSINLFSGSLTVAIPIGSKYKVGGDLDFSLNLFYNSNLWDFREDCPVGTSDPVYRLWTYNTNCVNTPGHGTVCTNEAFTQDDLPPRHAGDGCFTIADPNPMANAGMGWQLSLGKLFVPGSILDTPYNPLATEGGLWVYEAPDGSQHAFYSTQHELDPSGTEDKDPTTDSVTYTRDGSYLRMKVINAERYIEFPNGEVHIFRRFGSLSSFDWRLVQMRDQFGNFINVFYDANPQRWTITDSANRTLAIVDFIKHNQSVNPTVDRWDISSVKLASFGGQMSQYTFGYELRNIERAAPSVPDSPDFPTRINVAFLSSIQLPDGSAYSMPVSTSYDPDGTITDPKVRGVITGITLPTGGRIDWSYHGPNEGDGSSPRTYYGYPRRSSARNYARRSVGIRQRTVTENNHRYTWLYDPLPEVTPFSPSEIDPRTAPKLFINRVTTPEGHYSIHYFSFYPFPLEGSELGRDPRDWHVSEYGLPINKYADATIIGTDGKPLFLSEQVFQANTTTPLRSTYLRYDTDAIAPNNGWGNVAASNRQLAATRTVYHDDVVNSEAKFAEMLYSDFDGLGHYRKIETRGNFASGDIRTEITSYNPGNGTFVIDPATNRPGAGHNFTMFAETQPWVLGTYDSKIAIVGASTSTRQSIEQFNFENTGFLRRTRTVKNTGNGGAAPTISEHDIVVEYTQDHGNVTKVQYYGGDKQSISIAADLRSLTLVNPEYTLANTYDAAGALTTSKYADMPANLYSVNQSIDLNTSLVKTSYDTAEVATNYVFDGMGRITDIKPAGASATHIDYLPVDWLNRSNAMVKVAHKSNDGATVLHEEQFEYDQLGRLWKESKTLPSGASSILLMRELLYTGSGWQDSVSEFGNTNKKTRYLGYDPFGRPTVIRPPDSTSPSFAHDMTIKYFGVRIVQRTVNIGKDLTTSSPQVIREEASTKSEFYDRQGRLSGIDELSGTNGQKMSTLYFYDVGNRLIEATTVPANNPTQVLQRRTFSFDNRGYLTAEQLPEMANQSISYSAYDSMGHAGLQSDGVSNLRSTFDKAGRQLLLEDKSSTGAYRPLKQFTYGTGTTAANRSLGKVETASRYNYIKNPYNPAAPDIQVLINETYTYNGLDGRAGTRLTSSPTGPINFTQTFTYDALGNLKSQSYPTCTSITDNCYPVRTPRVVDYAYNQGLLTKVSRAGASPLNYATSLSYNSNGMLGQVLHGNNVTDTIAMDPNYMQRPASLSVDNVAAGLNWSSSTYQYDGSGNIVRIGANWYLYDKVNRLVEGTAMTVNKKQRYSFDTFGNVTGVTTYPSAAIVASGTEAGDDTAPELLTPIDYADDALWVDDGASFSDGLKSEMTPPAAEQPVENDGAAASANSTIGIDSSTNRLSGATFGYDTAGNLVRDGDTNPAARTYTYDSVNMIKYAPGVIYLYTADDQRIWTFDSRTGTPVETFTLRDLGGRPVREFQIMNGNAPGHWSWVKDYIYRGDKLLAEETPNGVRHYHLDHLGTPRLVTDANRNRLGFYQYFPLGEEASSPVSDGERLKFTGHERDSLSTGTLDYMHARYYKPVVAKFLTVDPGRDVDEQNPQSWNMYAYVRNNPMGSTDPTGKCSAPAGIGAGQVGICIEAFIAANRFEGVARGDNRTFSGNDPELTNRMELQMVVNPRSGTMGQNYSFGVSEVGISPAILSNRGSGSFYATGSKPITSPKGGAVMLIRAKGEGLNGFANFPGAPKATISIDVTLMVGTDGSVGILGGSRDGYPSFGIYAYNGKGGVATLLTGKENQPKDLEEPNEIKIPRGSQLVPH